MTDLTGESRRGVPVLLGIALLLLAAWLGWLWSQQAVVATSDAACFKQPAYMRLRTPFFSIPSYAGIAPAFDKVNSYPAVIYFYANYATFKLFGFGELSATGLDLAIHFALVALAALALWRLTACQLPGILLVACSGVWLLPVGRPEELGMLLVLAALLVVERGTWGLAAAVVGLGAAGATSPGAAIVGTVLLVTYDGLTRSFTGSFFRRAMMLLCLPVVLSLGLYLAYVWPFVAAAWEQHRTLTDNDWYWTQPLWGIAARDPRWAVSTLLPIATALALSGFAWWRRPAWLPAGSPTATFVTAAAVAIAAGTLLNVATERLEYHYRAVTVLSVAVIAICAGQLAAQRGATRVAAWALAGGLFLVALPQQRDIVRFTLAPLARGTDAVDYQAARQVVRDVVPPTATVGGDGSAWTLVDDGRPFLLTRMIGADQWPEYLVGRAWFREPIEGHRRGRPLDLDYEEITPLPRLPSDGCSLNVLGLRLPIARGRCDWYVRIWKRRAHAPPAAAASGQNAE